MLLELVEDPLHIGVLIGMIGVVDVLIDAWMELASHSVELISVIRRHDLLKVPLEERSVDVVELDGVHLVRAVWILAAASMPPGVELSDAHAEETLSHFLSPQDQSAIHVELLLNMLLEGHGSIEGILAANHAPLDSGLVVLLSFHGSLDVLSVGHLVLCFGVRTLH